IKDERAAGSRQRLERIDQPGSHREDDELLSTADSSEVELDARLDGYVSFRRKTGGRQPQADAEKSGCKEGHATSSLEYVREAAKFRSRSVGAPQSGSREGR